MKRAALVSWFMVFTVTSAFAQRPQASPVSMRGMRLRGALPFSQLAAASAYGSQKGAQPEGPALTLTWESTRFPGLSAALWLA